MDGTYHSPTLFLDCLVLGLWSGGMINIPPYDIFGFSVFSVFVLFLFLSCCPSRVVHVAFVFHAEMIVMRYYLKGGLEGPFGVKTGVGPGPVGQIKPCGIFAITLRSPPGSLAPFRRG